MPYEVLEQKLKTLPEQSLSEVDEFFNYILYKFNGKKNENANALDDGMALLDSIVGTVPAETNFENAKSEYFEEKYESAD